ncbi:amidohydrolase family protein [Aestuariibacter sp. GS-14]|uniref:amidohydrolase family protein n=1 Tax=Alteromonadaceae TaxID=72275 RepID=UPI001129A1CD|nr:amidohydrolase family protein [Aestuariibacter sp. GS-14]TPV54816.1 amidohydrolase family protein [Aestuariibacter sp. GS-14]
MRTIIKNARIFDGTGRKPFSGSVAVEGNRITEVSDTDIAANSGDRIINADGRVLMPGMVEAHAHLTWPTSVEKFVPGMYLPPEELALTAARNARILLDHGFTSAYSAGALSKKLEISLNEHLTSGGLPGPRLIPSSVEREPPNDSALDPGKADQHAHGPEGVKAFVKECADIGAKAVKFLISGENALKPGASHELLYSEEEILAAGEQAKASDVWLTGHAHAAAAVKLGVRAGFRVLYHCTYADDEAIDMLLANKDNMFVAPTIGIVQATLDATPPPHMDMTYMKEDAADVLAHQIKLVEKLKAGGMKLLPGGDYGFPFNPNGRNARDLELWVRHFNYTPEEVLHAATQLGGEIMGMGNELGLVKTGYLADLLLIDGDPTEDVTILQNKANISLIMKDGDAYKLPLSLLTTAA